MRTALREPAAQTDGGPGSGVLPIAAVEETVGNSVDAARPPALLTADADARGLETDESKFVPLWNGADLAGWIVQDGKPHAWRIREGAIECVKGSGGWLRTKAVYSDFELRFDVRLTSGANTGVGVRFPSAGSPTLGGIEIQLIDDTAEKYADLPPVQRTGSLYYHVPPLVDHRIAPGAWHAVAVTVRGDRIQVAIDGTIVNDVYLDQLPAGDESHPLQRRPSVGHVGFQSSSRPVELRHVRIHDLTVVRSSGLATIDLAVGTGDVCPDRASVTVDYVGRFTNGEQFDSSYDRGEPVTVALDQVIEGWQAGIPGMRVGGRRKLVVPAAMAYGDEGVPELIPPGATLVFEVELRGVER